MTRINANIRIQELTDQHLLAEHREIKRICNRYSARISKGVPVSQEGKSFTLGTGHEIFFLDKGEFTFSRYRSIYEECLDRGFNVTDFSHLWDCYHEQVDAHWENAYTFSAFDNDVIRYRIAKRILESKQVPRYRGLALSALDAVELLKFETDDGLSMLRILLKYNSERC